MNKSDFICKVPFQYTEVHADQQQFLCCSAWLPTNIYETENIKDNFLSDKSNKIRESILDGSYKYCDETQCPYLASLIDGKHLDNKFIPKYRGAPTTRMSEINFDFDRSCNLQCPSCRIEVINALGNDRKRVDATIEQIENNYSKELIYIQITSSGDPFYSKSFRQFLINIEPSKYPLLRNIHLHTNALLWTKKLWNKMKNAQAFINTVEVSIDAATKETYSITRKGGNFDILLENLKFITNIDTIGRFIFSFVVQKDNFREMKSYVDLIESYKGLKDKVYKIYFYEVKHWGTWTDEEFKDKQVSNPNHSLYSEFVEYLDQVAYHPKVGHNLHEHMTKLTKKLL